VKIKPVALSYVLTRHIGRKSVESIYYDVKVPILCNSQYIVFTIIMIEDVIDNCSIKVLEHIVKQH